MSPKSLELTIQVEHLQQKTVLMQNVPPTQPVIALLRRLLKHLHLEEPAEAWELLFQGKPLFPQQPIGDQLPPDQRQVVLKLQRCLKRNEAPTGSSDAEFELTLEAEFGGPPEVKAASTPSAGEQDLFEETDFDLPALEESGAEPKGLDESSSDFDLALDDSGATEDEESDSGVVPLDEESEDEEVETVARAMPRAELRSSCLEEDSGIDLGIDTSLDEGECDEAAETVSPPPAAALSKPAAAKPTVRQVAERRATVRYYERMNPERVYPLLVMITRQMVEKVVKKNTAQRTSAPFKADLDAVVEIEPILPGCVCYPPRVETRLGAKDFTATFHVVPHVRGKVSGAVVQIRQDHQLLAEVKLDVKVIQRTLVTVSASFALLMPFLSAILKHYQLDFKSQKEEGFSLYLAVAQVLFQNISPLTLTLLLLSLTGLFYFLTRPRVRDQFYDLRTIGPAEKLRQVAAQMKSDPTGGGAELMELLKAYPAYQPAKLYYAEWHYQSGSYEEALKGYEKAFKLGLATSRHYLSASLAASQLGLNEKALAILQEATTRLPADQDKGILFFNMGCYHVRLGQHEEALACLDKAVRAGYRKARSFLEDRDLEPLRGRPDFKVLLGELQKG